MFKDRPSIKALQTAIDQKDYLLNSIHNESDRWNWDNAKVTKEEMIDFVIKEKKQLKADLELLIKALLLTSDP